VTLLDPRLAALTAVGAACCAAGVWAGGAPRLSRFAIALGGAVLASAVLFSTLPEVAREMGAAAGSAGLAAGFALLWGVNRWIYPVCPSCSHTHDHEACEARLHGFAPPLLAAAALHNLLDGWAAAWSANSAAGAPVTLGLLLHKGPEALALGAILRAAFRSAGAALGAGLASQSTLPIGAALAMSLAPRIGAAWAPYLLAPAAGAYLFLGLHAVHGEWRRMERDRRPMASRRGVA
jgi:zinc transporter ZupT